MEALTKAGVTKVYELHIKLDERKEEAKLIDVMRSVSCRMGPREVRVRGGFFRGIARQWEIGKQRRIRETFALGTIAEYRFSNTELKHPVMNSVLRSGWDVRFARW